jgi:hypothetical protein
MLLNILWTHRSPGHGAMFKKDSYMSVLNHYQKDATLSFDEIQPYVKAQIW